MQKAACPWLLCGCQRHSVTAFLQSPVTSAWKKEEHSDTCTSEKCLQQRGEEHTDHRGNVMLEKWVIMVRSTYSAPLRFYFMPCVI